MSCSAVVRPASPTTYAVPCGRCSARNCAVASAEVQMASSGTSIPLPSSRARRSRGVKIELLVRTRKPSPEALSASTNSWAPGIGTSSWTSTPSMSVSQVCTSRVSVMGQLWWTGRPERVSDLPRDRPRDVLGPAVRRDRGQLGVHLELAQHRLCLSADRRLRDAGELRDAPHRASVVEQREHVHLPRGQRLHPRHEPSFLVL